MSVYTLRDYQQECVDEHFRYFENRRGNPLFVVPTGGGKSLIFADFARRIFENWSDQRVIALTHVQELIGQNHRHFCDHWGLLAPVGIYSAGLGRRDTRDSLIFAGIQSVYNKPEALGSFNLAVIDEAHLVPKVGQGRYLTYLAALREMNPRLRVIGYTATPYRLQGGLLHRGEGRIFTDIAYDIPVTRLIREGYLVPVVSKRAEADIDTSGVGTATGDFKKGELEDAALECTTAAVDEMVEIGRSQERKHWLVFGCGITHAGQILDRLRHHGIESEAVFGHTPNEERKAILKRAKDGKLTALVNVGVLTTGFDWPRCDLLGVMRPTQSTSLYVQMYGRGMRIFPAGGKKDCLALDYGRNVLRHGPIDGVVANDTGLPGDGDRRARVCPKCNKILSVATKVCTDCGYVFPVERREASHDRTASTADPINIGEAVFEPANPTVVSILRVEYERWEKRDGDGPNTLRVTYWSNLQRFSEWLCFDHPPGSYARRMAEEWWLQRAPGPVPFSVGEALQRSDELARPSQISVLPSGKYHQVVDHFFALETDHYQQLGVLRGASDEEIEAAYREKVRQWHPDKNGGSVMAMKTFKEVQAAYEAIKEGRKAGLR